MTKLLSEIEPSLNSMKTQIQDSVGADLRRLVMEELALQRMGKNKNGSEESNDEEDPESKKIRKYKKNIKI